MLWLIARTWPFRTSAELRASTLPGSTLRAYQAPGLPQGNADSPPGMSAFQRETLLIPGRCPTRIDTVDGIVLKVGNLFTCAATSIRRRSILNWTRPRYGESIQTLQPIMRRYIPICAGSGTRHLLKCARVFVFFMCSDRQNRLLAANLLDPSGVFAQSLCSASRR